MRDDRAFLFMIVRLPFLAAGKFGFHLSLEGWLEISFSFAAFEEDPRFVDASFETTHRVIDGFAFANSDFDRHWNSPPFRVPNNYTDIEDENLGLFSFSSRFPAK